MSKAISQLSQAEKRIAFDVMVKGYKSVGVIQALLLLTLWNKPAERFEEDHTFKISGFAIFSYWYTLRLERQSRLLFIDEDLFSVTRSMDDRGYVKLFFQFVYIAYAAVFLLKFSSTCDPLAVTILVYDCTVLLEEVLVDEKHMPALYAAFLKVLLNSKKGTSASPKDTDHSQPSTSTPLDPVATQRKGLPVNTAPDRVDHITGVPFPPGNQLDPAFGSSSELPSNVNCPILPFDLQPFEAGYSGPLYALSGGVGLVLQFNSHDQIGFGFTPTGSGRATPNHFLNHTQHHGNGNGNRNLNENSNEHV
ncbi:uncharacterized protein MELLADRAFT_109417 [Melampsora larici-populina 98AG31]|uniref:Uncharacterized protein n=1 Tax=Melampsora larici-populina (strain 98AG31 / pathotype 3-4-7) TaxID=747676 RepID=F4RWE5_MELLP|nr:uncharacterized protein MELLADRAFT_109417 [Melampsora larici-populina 98AG31]EGG03270.1 hypothetical protein MELLADRAFT_109417 [Melampsora larici-populina 98AG31]